MDSKLTSFTTRNANNSNDYQQKGSLFRLSDGSPSSSLSPNQKRRIIIISAASIVE
jgi:hypothetical protein